MLRCLLACLPLLLLADRLRAADPPPALMAAIEKARALPDEARTAALGHLAWAAAEAGQPALARELANGLGQERAATTVSLAWSAAALARAGAADEAATRYRVALARVPKEGGAKTLEAWFSAWFAGLFAGGESPAAPSAARAELGQAWVEAVRRLGRPEAIVGLLAKVAPSLAPAGLGEPAAALARDGLRGSLMAAEDAATVLCALEDAAAARDGLGRAARAAPEEVDEFLVLPLVAAWRGAPGARDALRALSKELAAAAPYAGRLVRLAEVGRSVEDEAPDAADLLRAALEDAWTHGPPAGSGAQPAPGELERLRLVVRLVARAPAALPPLEALALLEDERRRAKERERTVYVLTEHLAAQAEAAGRVADPDALILVKALLDDAEALAGRARSGGIGPPALAYETHGACAEAAGLHGGEQAAALVEAAVARGVAAIERLTPIERKQRDGAPLFHPAMALVRCAKAALHLERPELAGRALDAALARLHDGPASDAADALAAAADAVAAAPWPERGELLGRVVARLGLVQDQPAWAVADVYRALAAALAAP